MRIDRKNQLQVNTNVDWFLLEKMQLVFMAKKLTVNHYQVTFWKNVNTMKHSTKTFLNQIFCYSRPKTNNMTKNNVTMMTGQKVIQFLNLLLWKTVLKFLILGKTGEAETGSRKLWKRLKLFKSQVSTKNNHFFKIYWVFSKLPGFWFESNVQKV